MKTVAIVGAGIIGLSIALELAARGLQVSVFERGRVMQQASWAAAGMLAADDPENPAELAGFSQFSRSWYPAFLSKLKGVSLLTTTTVQICESTRISTAGDVLEQAEAMRRVPGLRLAPGECALWLQEQSLDPRALCLALPLAADGAGVSIHEDTPVNFTEERGDRIFLETAQGTFCAESLIVTTGAWAAEDASPSLHHLPAGSVRPRKGQMLRLREPENASLTTVLRSPEVYIVPRANGTLIVGATVEDAGFDRSLREDATAWLLHEAAHLWSPLEDVSPDQVEAVWTGLRPVTDDQLPVIGSLNHPNIFFATGHYRNGILLAPGTAKVIASLLFDETPAIDLRPFQPARLLHPTSKKAAVHEAVAL